MLFLSLTSINKFVFLALYGLSGYWPFPGILLAVIIILLIAVLILSFYRNRKWNQLLHNEENLQAVLENIQDGYYRTDNEGSIIYSSPSALKILGIKSPDKIKGVNVRELYANAGDRDALLAKLKKSGRITDFEVKLRRMDGQIVVASVSSAYWRDSDGNILGIEGIFRDITERKRAEEALLESREKMRAIFNTATEGIIVTDLEVKIVEINNAMLKMAGYSDESEVISRSAFDFVVEEDHDLLWEGIREMLAVGSMSNWILTIHKKDGSRIKMEIHPAVLRDKSGNPIGLMAILQDITERMKAEEKLRRSEEFSRAVIDRSPLGVSVRSGTGKLISVNKAWKSIWAFPEEQIQRDMTAVKNELKFDERDDYLDQWQSDVERVYKEGGYLHVPEVRVPHPLDGGAEWVSQYFYAIKDDSGRVERVIILTEDITERKHAEMAMRESEEKYRSLVEGSHDAIFSVNRQGKFLFMNGVAARKAGGSAEEFIGRSMWDIFPNYTADIQMTYINRIFNTGESEISESVTELQGRKYHYSTSLQPIRNQKGAIESILGTARDISKNVQTEEELKTERDFVRSLLETANSLIVCLDSRAMITIFNKECEKVTGYSREEVLGKSWPDIFLTEETRHDGLKNFAEWVRKHPSDVYEGQLKTKSGEIRTILWSNSSLFTHSSDDVVAIAVGQDITERKIAEKALKESEIRFREVLGNSRDILYRLNLDTNTYDYMSESVTSLTGYTPEEIISMGTEGVQTLVHPDDLKHYCEIRKRLLETSNGAKLPFISEYRMKWKDGKYHWFSDSYALIRNKDGRPKFIIGNVRDITEQKKAEEVLRESEHRYALATEATRAGVWDWNLETNKFYLDPAVKMNLGYRDDEIPNDIEVWSQYIYPDDRQETMDAAQAHIEGRTPEYICEHRMVHKDGSVRWILARGRAIRNSDGKAIRLVGTDVDVTARKEAEEALRQSEEKYRLLVENVQCGIILIDYNGAIVFTNENSAEKLGLSVDEMLKKTIRDLFPEELAGHMMNNIRMVIESGKEHLDESRVLMRGEWRWHRALLQPFGDSASEEILALVIAYDITDLKAAEARNNARLELLRKLNKAEKIDECLNFGCRAIYDAGLYKRSVLSLHNRKREITNIGYMGLDDAVIETARNQPAPNINLAKKLTQEKYRISHSYFIPEEDSPIKEAVPRHIVQSEYEFYHDRSWRSGDELFVPIIGDNDIFEGWLSVDTPMNGLRPSLETVQLLEEIVDIVNQKVREIKTLIELRRGHEALRQSKEKFRTQFKASPMPVYTWQRQRDDFVLIDYNDASESITKGKISDFVGIKCSEMYRDNPDVMDDFKKCYDNKSTIQKEMNYTLKTTGQDRILVVTYIYVPPDLIMVHTDDITERRKAEQKVRAADKEKIAQARRIAGAFAHEIRNRLFPATVALNKLKTGSSKRRIEFKNVHKYASIAESSITKTADITKLISTYNKIETEVLPERINPSDVVDELIGSNQIRIDDESVTVNISGDKGVWVRSNRRQLLMALNNLLINSLDALKDVTDRHISIKWEINENFLYLTFEDNGCGIQTENLPRIFEPFFSAKSNAESTGLGLAMARRIIEMYGGKIGVNSQPGRGTRFDINLKLFAKDK